MSFIVMTIINFLLFIVFLITGVMSLPISGNSISPHVPTALALVSFFSFGFWFCYYEEIRFFYGYIKEALNSSYRRKKELGEKIIISEKNSFLFGQLIVLAVVSSSVYLFVTVSKNSFSLMEVTRDLKFWLIEMRTLIFFATIFLGALIGFLSKIMKPKNA